MRYSVFLLASSIFVLQSTSLSFASAQIDPALLEFSRGETSAKKTLIIGLLNTPQSLGITKPQRYQSREVIEYLKGTTRSAWQLVEQSITRVPTFSKTVHLVRLHWISNSFTAEVTPTGLKILAALPFIKKIYANHEIEAPSPVRTGRTGTKSGLAPLPYDYAETGLDKLVAEFPQITGKGIVLGSVDTGVDAKHPALAGKIVTFYDASTNKVTEPYDSDYHGTHTIGTMVGGDRKEVTIGVAPDARIVSAGPLTNYDGILRQMQFMLDPDQNPSTADAPKAVNNSWNCNGASDVELFYRAISAWEAAGILPIFSAGNSGPNKKTITRPHEHPSVIAVGSTGPDGKISSFSSRGPAIFKGEVVQKPDFTAPGDKIISSVPGSGYKPASGTSMAAPHVTGATALLWQINPKLNPIQMRLLLTKSVDPVDENGAPTPTSVWNEAYGFGKLNIYKAAKLALEIREHFQQQSFAWIDLAKSLLITPQQIDMLAFEENREQLDPSSFEMPSSLESHEW